MRSKTQLRWDGCLLEDRTVPTTYTVNTLNDVVAVDGLLSLREAIQASNENLAINEAAAGSDTTTDVIRFNLPAESVLPVYHGQFNIWDDLDINGPTGGITLDALKNSRVFEVWSGATVSLLNLDLQNGSAAHLSNINGGAVKNLGTLTMQSCAITDSITLVAGGGIFSDGTLTMRNCLVARNESVGGALGSSGYGGGLLGYGTITLENSTFSSNIADNNGGGIYYAGSALTITNTTLTNNIMEATVSGGGAGIFVNGMSVAPATFKNSIIAGNTMAHTPNDLGTYSTLAGNNNLIGVGAGGFTNGVNGNLVGVTNPLLGPLANNGGNSWTHALLAGSPAINAGDNTSLPSVTYDQRGTGYIRTFGTNADIGAFEFQPPTNLTLEVSEAGDIVDSDFSAGKLSLREAVLAANARTGTSNITFAPSVSEVVLTQGQLTLDGDINITGSGVTIKRSPTASASRLLRITPQHEVHLSGFTLSGGSSPAAGGAILNEGTLTLTKLVLDTNTATTSGGAIQNATTGTLTLENSTISNNVATTRGGAIFSDGVLTVRHSLIVSNTAIGQGGGIFSTGSLALEASTIVANTGTVGGGINASDDTTIRNSTISTNFASGNGGGLVLNGRTTLVNSTITQNHTDNDDNGTGVGGGFHVVAGTVNVFNTLVADNYKGSGTTIENDVAGSTLAVRSTNNLIGTGGSGGLIDGTNANRVGVVNPLLGPLVFNGGSTPTHALQPGSPALEMGYREFVILPTTVTSSTAATDFKSANQLIGGGLSSGSLAAATLASVTHNGNINGMWATNNPTAEDYFFGSNPNPVLTFQLGGLFDLSGLVLWGYDGSQGEAKSFTVAFSTDGGATFGNSLQLNRTALTGPVADQLSFGTVVQANAVRVTITDNFYDGTGTGGDRVGFAEIRFLGSAGTTDQRGAGFSRWSGSAIDVGASEQVLAFEDDFTRANAKVLGAPWKTQAGSLLINGEQATMSGVRPSVATVEGLSFGSVEVSAIPTLAAGQEVGLLARYTGSGDRNYYLGSLADNGGSFTARIVRNVNGVVTELASAAVAAPGALRFSVVGNQLKFFVEGVEVASATDTTFATGRVGLRLLNGASADTFRVSPVSNSLPVVATFEMPDFSPLASGWQTAFGNYLTQFNMADGQDSINIALLTAVQEANVDLSAYVEVQSTAGQFAGLVARYAGNGNKNFYLGQLTQTTKGTFAQIIKNVNGKATTLKSVPVASGTATLRFTVVGQQLRLDVDGVEVASAIDATFTTGACGIRSSANAFLDHFTATTVTTEGNFNDDFNNTVLGNVWNSRLGSFTVMNDMLTASSTKLTSQLATVAGNAVAEVEVRARVAVYGLNQRAGVVARYTGTGDKNYYLAEIMQTKKGPIARLVKNLNGKLTTLGSVDLLTSDVEISLRASGTTLQLAIDGQVQLTAVDSSFSRGHVGVRLTGPADVDDFAMEVLLTKLGHQTFFEGSNGDPIGSAWATLAGNYEYTDGQVAGRDAVNLAVVRGLEASNTRTTAYVTLEALKGEFASLAARIGGVDNTNMYRATIRHTGTTYVAAIERQIGKVVTTLATVNLATGTGLLTFEVNGTHLRLTFGDVVLSTSDTQLTSGLVGIRSSMNALFDHFETACV